MHHFGNKARLCHRTNILALSIVDLAIHLVGIALIEWTGQEQQTGNAKAQEPNAGCGTSLFTDVLVFPPRKYYQ